MGKISKEEKKYRKLFHKDVTNHLMKEQIMILHTSVFSDLPNYNKKFTNHYSIWLNNMVDSGLLKKGKNVVSLSSTYEDILYKSNWLKMKDFIFKILNFIFRIFKTIISTVMGFSKP